MMTQSANKPNHGSTRDARKLRRNSHHAFGVALVLSTLVLHSGVAFSQSAGNFGAKPTNGMAASQAPKSTPSANAKANPSSTIPPSRFVAEADFDTYVKSLSGQLSMKDRATDPFGQQQDPNAKVVKAKEHKPGTRPKPVQTTPFPEIISQIHVNTIMPREKKFLIGSRTYKQGGALSIIHRGKTILAQILAVSAKQIEFRHQETGETATLKLDALPVGMTPGNHGISAPGMTPALQDAPINLDVGNP